MVAAISSLTLLFFLVFLWFTRKQHEENEESDGIDNSEEVILQRETNDLGHEISSINRQITEATAVFNENLPSQQESIATLTRQLSLSSLRAEKERKLLEIDKLRKKLGDERKMNDLASEAIRAHRAGNDADRDRAIQNLENLDSRKAQKLKSDLGI